MPIVNPYASLAEYTNYVTPRGQSVTTDTTDDATMSAILDQAAREVETRCGNRTFYPRYEKRYYDVPVYQNSPRILFLDDDLLEVVTITNGDKNVVTSDLYNLKPKNYSPHYAIQLIGPISVFWIFDVTNGNIEKVISVEGWWGFHNRYEQRAWTLAGTIATAITTTTATSITMTAGHTLVKDTIIKIDNEIFNLTNVSSNTLTVTRGDNGSTAATHLILAPVYVWNVQPEIKIATMMLAQSIYQQRFGITTVFGAGGGKTEYPEPDLHGFLRPT
jgi:hypothetical protein